METPTSMVARCVLTTDTLWKWRDPDKTPLPILLFSLSEVNQRKPCCYTIIYVHFVPIFEVQWNLLPVFTTSPFPKNSKKTIIPLPIPALLIVPYTPLHLVADKLVKQLHTSILPSPLQPTQTAHSYLLQVVSVTWRLLYESESHVWCHMTCDYWKHEISVMEWPKTALGQINMVKVSKGDESQSRPVDAYKVTWWE